MFATTSNDSANFRTAYCSRPDENEHCDKTPWEAAYTGTFLTELSNVKAERDLTSAATNDEPVQLQSAQVQILAPPLTPSDPSQHSIEPH